MARRRGVPLPGPDERAHPRGDPAGRLRRHRRARGWRRCGRGSTATVDVSPAVLLGWGYPWLQRFGPWQATVENSYALDRLIYAEIAERTPRPGPRRPHRRPVPADPGGGRRRPAHRRGAARPARHPAARGPRDDRDRAVVGALRDRPRPGAARAGARRRPRRRRRRLARGGAQGVDAPAPDHPDGGPDPDRSPRPSAAATSPPGPPSAPRSCSPTPARRTTPTPRSSGPSGSSARTRPPTPGSRSAAASGAASARASP